MAILPLFSLCFHLFKPSISPSGIADPLYSVMCLSWAEGEVLRDRVPAGHPRLQRAGWTHDPLYELRPQEETLLQGHRQGHRHAWRKEYVWWEKPVLSFKLNVSSWNGWFDYHRFNLFALGCFWKCSMSNYYLIYLWLLYHLQTLCNGLKSRCRFKTVRRLKYDLKFCMFAVSPSCTPANGAEWERELFTQFRGSWGSSLGALSLTFPLQGPHGIIIDSVLPPAGCNLTLQST